MDQEENGGFRSMERPWTFTLTDAAGYLNASASRGLERDGRYVQLMVDPVEQKIRIISHREPGSGRYLLVNKGTGNPVQTRDKLTTAGMRNGIYLHTGDRIFQHIDYID